MISGVQQCINTTNQDPGFPQQSHGRVNHIQYAIHWFAQSEALHLLIPRLVSRYSLNKDRELMLILYVQKLFRPRRRPIHDAFSFTPTPRACRYKAGSAEKDIDRQSKPYVYHD